MLECVRELVADVGGDVGGLGGRRFGDGIRLRLRLQLETYLFKLPSDATLPGRGVTRVRAILSSFIFPHRWLKNFPSFPTLNFSTFPLSHQISPSNVPTILLFFALSIGLENA